MHEGVGVWSITGSGNCRTVCYAYQDSIRRFPDSDADRGYLCTIAEER